MASKRKMTMTQITAGNFHEYFNLDYPAAIAAVASNIDDSTGNAAVVTRLVNWCAERGYYVSREVCCDVLVSHTQNPNLSEMDDE